MNPPDAGDTGAPSCAKPAPGCACDAVGTEIACGSVHQTSGTYISCSPGFLTCTAAHQWSSCEGDRVGDPRSPTHGFGLNSLQLDAGPCAADPCDPSCQSFVDTASGVDGGLDSGLVWGDAGVTLSPVQLDSGPACSGFTISPSTNLVTVTSIPKSTDPVGTPITATYSNGQQYSATVTPPGCFIGTVPALWGIDRYDIATMTPLTGQFALVVGQATPSGLPINIASFVGAFPQQTATATVSVNVLDTSALPPLSTLPATFATTATTNEPAGVALLYPYNGTMFPLGLIPPVIQWRTTDTSSVNHPATAVKVTLRYPDVSPVFTWSAITNVESPVATAIPALVSSPALPAAPRFQMDPNVWNAFAQTAKGGGNGAITIQRYYGGVLYKEFKVNVRFANGQLKGTVYYNSYETKLVKNSNYLIGDAQVGAASLAIKPGQSAPTLAAGDPGSTAGEGCRVCHTVSGDGTRLITQKGSDYTQSYTYNLVNDAGSDKPIAADNGTLAWIAMTSNGAYGFGNGTNGSLPGSGSTTSKLYNMADGGAVTSDAGIPAGLNAAMPSFSPDNAHVAFNYYSSDNKSLATMDFNYSTLRFSNLQKIYTPGSGYTVWPVWMPSSDRIVMGVQTAGGYGETWESAAATIGWIDTSTKTFASLANANGVSLPAGGTNHTSSGDAQLNFEPTVNPQVTGGYAWMVFTSRRLFGNVATLDPFCSDGRNCTSELTLPTPKKLWMAAIDPNAAAGTDGSFAAFYLPGQELLAGNSRGFWVLNACEPPGTDPVANGCDSDLDCCQAPSAERCVAQTSTPPIQKYCTAVPSSLSCVADNASCSVITNCCGALTGSACIGGVCKPPPPLVNYNAASFTRDYTASCPGGFSPLWRFFTWQSSTPGDSTIQFTAQSAANAAGIVSAMSPAPVAIGTAKADPTWMTDGWPSIDQTPTWTGATSTVDSALVASGQTSQTLLRVTARLSPATSPVQTPVLEDWRATYDCVATQ